MTIKVGSAPDSWGVWFPSDARQTPWERYLDEVSEAGYRWTELGPPGYLPPDPALLRRVLAQHDLQVTGAFVMKHFEDASAWPDTEKEALAVGGVLAALEAPYLVLIDDTYSDLFTGKLTRGQRLEGDRWQQLIETVNRLGRLARERYGLTAVFHPHAETHVEYEDQIESLLAQTDPAYVSMCLDTGHHAYRGGDPVAFMRKHHARIRYLHLKSVDPAKQKQVAAEHIPFAIAVGQDMFCEPALGAVDFLAFRDVLHEVGYDGYAIVEQDMYPAPFDKPLPIARRTRGYLRAIGIG